METTREAAKPTSVDFFISYTGGDVEWARWIAWELSRAGYSYRMQADDFPPGARFMNQMRTSIELANRVLAVLSPAYFSSPFASLEMQAAMAGDPLGLTRRVVPVLVEACTIPDLFRDLVYIDFVGKGEMEQRRSLTAGIRAALFGSYRGNRDVRDKPPWPGRTSPRSSPAKGATANEDAEGAERLRVQFIACDVGRGLDLRGEFERIRAAVAGSRLAGQIDLRGEFDVTDANLFQKLNGYAPQVVHISGNQNGGDVLLPSGDGGEVVVPDEALAGLLSSLGKGLRLVIVDTCMSYRCAKRIAEVVDFAVGVNEDIYDDEATRFYEVFYQAVGTGHSVGDAHGQATAALRFIKVPANRIPKLCVRPGRRAKEAFLVGPSSNE